MDPFTLRISAFITHCIVYGFVRVAIVELKTKQMHFWMRRQLTHTHTHTDTLTHRYSVTHTNAKHVLGLLHRIEQLVELCPISRFSWNANVAGQQRRFFR